MGSIQVSHVGWRRPGGAELLDDVGFSVGNGEKVALVGANGVGKTTLLRLISGEATPTCGTISIDGRLGVMRQLVGTANDTMTARDLMVSLAPKQLQIAAARLISAEADAVDQPMRYAHALAEWGDAGGYDAEVFWDTCATRAVGLAFFEIADRALRTLSGESRSGSRSKRSCAAISMCSCSTSPTTSWTWRESAGWRTSYAAHLRRCCSSATTASCSR